MATILNADTISGGFIATGDSSGILQLQSSGTPSLTLNTSGAHGVGSSPSYGTSGQVLQSNGSSAAPSWVTPSSGAMTLISTQTANNTADSVQFTGLSGYDKYMIIIENLTPSSSGQNITLQVGTGTGPTYVTSAYSFYTFNAYGASGSSFSFAQSLSQSYFVLGAPFNGAYNSGSGCSGFFILSSMNNSKNTSISGNSIAAYNSGGSLEMNEMQGFLSNTIVKTAVKVGFIGSGVNATSGTVSLYGISS